MSKKLSPKYLKIGIDIDNVIADSYPRYINAFNEKFGTAVKYEEVYDFYYLENYVGVDKAATSHFIETVLHSEKFQLAIPPYEEPKTIIQKWAESGHLIHYITARPIAIKDITLHWLKNHGFWVKGAKLHLLDVDQEPSHANFKKEIVDKWKVDIFVEDTKGIAETLNIPVLLLDRPWNQGKLPKNVKRVKDWKEIDYFVANSLR